MLPRPFGNLKESETIERFAAVRAGGGGKCYPSPGVNGEGLKTGVRPPGPPGDTPSAGAGWAPGLQNNAVDKQHAQTIFYKATGIQRVLPPQ